MYVQRAVTLVIGVAGALIGLVLWHLYEDHRVFHALMHQIVAARAGDHP